MCPSSSLRIECSGILAIGQEHLPAAMHAASTVATLNLRYIQKKLGAVDVSWQSRRLILVASSCTKYDTYAVNQLQPNIELLPYQRYDNGTLVLDSINEPISSKKKVVIDPVKPGTKTYDLEYH